MTLTIMNGSIEVLDPIPWMFHTFRRRKASLPTLLQPVEVSVLLRYQRGVDRQHEASVREVGRLDYLYLLEQPSLSGHERICRVADTLGMTHDAVTDALDEYDALFEAV